jgi:sugar porter (SP) family MFS transporter
MPEAITRPDAIIVKPAAKDKGDAEHPAKSRTKGFLIFVTGVTAIAGFLYGYDTGIISGALLQIRKEFRLSHQMQEIVASAILVGAVIGALSCGWLFERIGRKRTLTLLAAVYALGAISCSLAPNPILLIAGRIFLGFAVGGSSQTAPVYVAELAPAEGRGHFVTSFNVAIGLGIVAANLVQSTLNDVWSWRWMIAVAAVPAAVFFLCTWKIPESPRWLVGQSKRDQAREELTKVRTDEGKIDAEIKEIEEITAKEENAPVKGWRGLGQPWVRPAVIAALGVAAFTQLTGIEMMVYYAPTMLTGVGFSHSGALRASLWLAIVYAVMTTLGLSIVDRVGRRRLSLWMLPGAAIALLVLGALLAFHLAEGKSAWLIVASLLTYMFFNAGGIQVVGWLSGSEMYPLSVRGAGSSAQATVVWGADLLVTMTALTLVHALSTGGTMWVYAAMNVLAFFFTLRFVPETAGRSLEDIENSLRKGEFHP